MEYIIWIIIIIIMPSDYSKAKIYLIKSPNIDMIYVGETTLELKKRFSGHKSDHKLNKECTSKIIIAAGDAYIELYENYPCNSSKDSKIREKEVIKLFWDKCVNKCKYFDKKEYQKEYYDKNKVEILAKVKEYNDKNKVEILAQKKKYRDKNKVKINAKAKEYWAKNNDEILAQKKAYQEKNRDEINAKQRARYAAKKLLLIT